MNEEPKKPANDIDEFKQPGTNKALRRVSTVRFAEGTKDGPPNRTGPPAIRKMSCLDEAPKESKWQGLVKSFKNFWGFKNKTSKIEEIKV